MSEDEDKVVQEEEEEDEVKYSIVANTLLVSASDFNIYIYTYVDIDNNKRVQYTVYIQ